MRFPAGSYQIPALLAQHLGPLSPAQRRALAWWVLGVVLAQSACQSAVVTALLPLGGRFDGVRQYLREWLYDGSDKAAPNHTQVAVETCFAPLLRWVLTWYTAVAPRRVALALDATLLGDRLAVLVISVLYRGCAIPVAWAVLPANRKGAWLPRILGLLDQLAPAVPAGWGVLFLTDRGLWSPRLWQALKRWRWQPLMRVQRDTLFQAAGQRRQRADRLVGGPGQAWVGRGTAFRDRERQQRGTLLVVWTTQQADPWAVLTRLRPERVGVSWYALRMWVELGFRALKGVGWQWQRTRRSAPPRVARHWLVLAVATLVTLGVGTRVEDAQVEGIRPEALVQPPAGLVLRPRTAGGRCRVSIFALGRSWLRTLLVGKGLWRQWWLRPEPWPQPPPGLVLHYHADAPT